MVVVVGGRGLTFRAGLSIPLSAEGRCCCFFVVRGRHDTMLSEALGGRLCYSNIVISPVDWPSPIPPYHVALGQGERVSSTLE